MEMAFCWVAGCGTCEVRKEKQRKRAIRVWWSGNQKKHNKLFIFSWRRLARNGCGIFVEMTLVAKVWRLWDTTWLESSLEGEMPWSLRTKTGWRVWCMSINFSYSYNWTSLKLTYATRQLMPTQTIIELINSLSFGSIIAPFTITEHANWKLNKSKFNDFCQLRKRERMLRSCR